MQRQTKVNIHMWYVVTFDIWECLNYELYRLLVETKIAISLCFSILESIAAIRPIPNSIDALNYTIEWLDHHQPAVESTSPKDICFSVFFVHRIFVVFLYRSVVWYYLLAEWGGGGQKFLMKSAVHSVLKNGDRRTILFIQILYSKPF